MDSLLSPVKDAGLPSSNSAAAYHAKAFVDSSAIQSLYSANSKSDKVSTTFDDLYKSLSVTAREIVDSINEMLKEQLPDGVQSLKPEDVTPEATAEQIVKGISGLFAAFEKQNPDLEGEELINKFMEAARSGVEQGYSEAFEILDGLGAFQFDGVQSGIEKTKSLLDEKLSSLEQQLRKRLGIDSEETMEQNDSSAPIKNSLLAQGGANSLYAAA